MTAVISLVSVATVFICFALVQLVNARNGLNARMSVSSGMARRFRDPIVKGQLIPMMSKSIRRSNSMEKSNSTENASLIDAESGRQRRKISSRIVKVDGDANEAKAQEYLTKADKPSVIEGSGEEMHEGSGEGSGMPPVVVAPIAVNGTIENSTTPASAMAMAMTTIESTPVGNATMVIGTTNEPIDNTKSTVFMSGTTAGGEATTIEGATTVVSSLTNATIAPPKANAPGAVSDSNLLQSTTPASGGYDTVTTTVMMPMVHDNGSTTVPSAVAPDAAPDILPQMTATPETVTKTATPETVTMTITGETTPPKVTGTVPDTVNETATTPAEISGNTTTPSSESMATTLNPPGNPPAPGVVVAGITNETALPGGIQPSPVGLSSPLNGSTTEAPAMASTVPTVTSFASGTKETPANPPAPGAIANSTDGTTIESATVSMTTQIYGADTTAMEKSPASTVSLSTESGQSSTPAPIAVAPAALLHETLMNGTTEATAMATGQTTPPERASTISSATTPAVVPVAPAAIDNATVGPMETTVAGNVPGQSTIEAGRSTVIVIESKTTQERGATEIPSMTSAAMVTDAYGGTTPASMAGGGESTTKAHPDVPAPAAIGPGDKATTAAGAGPVTTPAPEPGSTVLPAATTESMPGYGAGSTTEMTLQAQVRAAGAEKPSKASSMESTTVMTMITTEGGQLKTTDGGQLKTTDGGQLKTTDGGQLKTTAESMDKSTQMPVSTHSADVTSVTTAELATKSSKIMVKTTPETPQAPPAPQAVEKKTTPEAPQAPPAPQAVEKTGAEALKVDVITPKENLTVTITENVSSPQSNGSAGSMAMPVQPSGYEGYETPSDDMMQKAGKAAHVNPAAVHGYDGIDLHSGGSKSTRPGSRKQLHDVVEPRFGHNHNHNHNRKENNPFSALFSLPIKTVDAEANARLNWHPFVMDCDMEIDDRGELCAGWARGGLCLTHRPTMFLFCRRTCLCTGPPPDYLQ